MLLLAHANVLHVDFTGPSEAMFTQLKWITFPERVVYRKSIQMYKTVCGDVPDYLHLRFIQHYSDHLPIFSFIHQDPIQNYFVTRSFFQAIWNFEYIKTALSVKHFKSLYLRWYKQLLITSSVFFIL